MERREFLTTGAAGLAGVTTSVGVAARALAAVGTPAGGVQQHRRGSPSGMLAPAADYPYAVRQGYFNNAALGLSPVPVRAKMRAIDDGIATEGASYFFKAIKDLTETPRVAAARLYGTKPENIGLTRSISETVCQFAWWLRPARGKNVVSIDIDVPATTLPWMRVARETGAEVRLAQVWSDPGSLSVEKVIQLIDANTAAVCVSHVQWVTGYRMDLKALADAAHAHNALLIVDAMHTTGVVPIDVHRDDVDVLVAGGYKWLGGVTGIAACYVRPELMARLDPILLGADTNQPKPPYDEVESRFIQLPDGPGKFEYCSSSHSARVGFGAGGMYLADMGLDRIEAHVHRLGTILAEGIQKLGGVVVTPEDPARRAGIITAKFKGNGPALAEALEKRGIYVSPRKGMIRFACHVFNDDDGVHSVLSALRQLV